MIENRNICLVGLYSGWISGGTSVHPTTIARLFSKKNKISYVTNGPEKRIFRENENMTVYMEKATRHHRFFKKFIRTYSLRKNVDIFHIHDPILGLYACIEPTKPTILTIHGYLTKEAVANKSARENGLIYKILLNIQRVSAKKADAVIAVDKKIYEWLLSDEIGCEKNKLYHIPNGADTVNFSPEVDSSDVRKRYDLSLDDKIIVCGKHFETKNGIEYLIRAIPLILHEYPQTKLLLMGDGPLRKHLQQIVQTLNLIEEVIFCGRVSHEIIPQYYAASDVTVIPSIEVNGVEEATSISLLEAMATGKPVVASNIGGMKELLSGKNIGILVPDKNIYELSKAIISIFDYPNHAHSLGTCARDYVVRNHSWDKVAEQISAVYQKSLR